MRSPRDMPVDERLRRKVVVRESGCWTWVAAADPVSGYGKIHWAGKVRFAHRLSYETFVGPIPDGMQIDHLCHNRDEDCPPGPCVHRRCIAPDHLSLTTPLGNTHSGKGHASKTHCPQGHPYDAENTRASGGRRYCRACIAARQPLPDRHGTTTNYAYGCRCDVCRQASREYDAARRRAGAA